MGNSSSFSHFLVEAEGFARLREAMMEDRHCHDQTLALLTMAIGEVVETVTGADPLADLRARLHQWSREVDRGRELLGAVTAARAAVERRTDQRATRRLGLLANVLRRDQLREQRRQRVRNGDNVFIDSDEEAALRSGSLPCTAGPGRNVTAGPSRTQPALTVLNHDRSDVPREHRLVPIEWQDENKESGFRVVPAYDLTFEDD